jgi:hypothetical protein
VISILQSLLSLTVHIVDLNDRQAVNAQRLRQPVQQMTMHSPHHSLIHALNSYNEGCMLNLDFVCGRDACRFFNALSYHFKAFAYSSVF